MNKYNNIKLVGFVGSAGCGKDTLGDMLVEEGWNKIAFADSLKEMCIEFLGLSHDDVYTQEGKMKHNDFWGMTNREILQKVGTDAFRNGFHKDTWVKIMELKLKKALSENKKIVVTDIRFDNEAALIEKLGGVVFKIVRPNLVSNLSSSEQQHVSEQGISDCYIARVINNVRDLSYLKMSFDNHIYSIENNHNHIAQKCYNIVNDKKADDDLGSTIILCFKKYLINEINAILPLSDKHNFRMEWNHLKNYICFMITDNSKIIFKGISRDKDKTNYELSFDINDDDKWQELNKWINLNK